jgi:hypothetical protein
MLGLSTSRLDVLPETWYLRLGIIPFLLLDLASNSLAKRALSRRLHRFLTMASPLRVTRLHLHLHKDLPTLFPRLIVT